ncbi:acyl-CoA--sterol O-acyltransferase 1-like [Cynara cardunculus var. scolymus]|uniref:Wax synthase domain-containing protein n=1 Tax=Cynara cardunculus var. scolymus TaxID=59895 RepID=A0A103XDB1_CYNCS|nr:acyl-CoA--sterol O-acyltransferase 1-like [Cynara cardunculus var. scolymus]KVH88673.1 hypothetical protein Ccrd_026159 [Cynara cardunculus var. scolymus]
MEFEEDIKNLVKVSLFASVSLGYCYFVGKNIPKGFQRLLMILPVVLTFFSIPLFFNSVHLIGALSLYIAWLANFKLLLFAFEKGPLSAPSVSLSVFLSFACFPIGKRNAEKNPSQKSIFNYGVKALLLAIFLKVYHDYGDDMNRMIAWILFACSVYFFLELILVVSSITVELLLGVKLDPQFDEPYLSTSLQDFWGRRWNVMVNRILYPTIYNPVRTLSTKVIGRMWAPVPAVLTTFAVSGLMHELIFYYFTRDWPTWHTMLFFCIHGVSLVTEIMIKKSVNFRWSLPRHIATPLVMVFVLWTSYLLFFPELLRCKIIERAFEDYRAMAKIATGFV